MGVNASALVLSLFLLVLGIFFAAYGANLFGPALIVVALVGLVVASLPPAAPRVAAPEPPSSPSSLLAQPPSAPQGKSVEQRLAELADLHAKGLIDDADLRERRHAILQEV